MVDRTVSLCITNFDRDKMLFQSFEQVLSDDRVNEIVIVDDVSKDQYFKNVQEFCGKYPKIKLFRNKENIGCYRNKREAISKAQNEFVIIFDSDNIMTKDYLDAVYSVEWEPKTILAPEKAGPFDYRRFAGNIITRETVARFMTKPMFDTCLNTMNYFVNRYEYLRIWDGSIEPWTADTIYQNYRWLNEGNAIHILKGLQYFHRTEYEGNENQSHYKQHVRKTGYHMKATIEKLKRMK